jgi:hypothetical protein
MSEKVLRDIYGHLAGMLLVQKLIVQAMITQGVLDRQALIDIVNMALDELTEEDKRESFGKSIVSLYRMSVGKEKGERALEGSFPDWMTLIGNLPPLGTDTSQS